MRSLFSLLFVFSLVTGFAQMPDTDIWLFSVDRDKTGKYVWEDPLNITGRKGYDNQPSFSPDGRSLYFVSELNGQTDVVAYDIRKKKTAGITSGTESEYSPRPYVSAAGLSAVVVEKDSAQRIHILNAETGTFVKKLDTDSIGYYTFLNNDTVVFYKLTEPHSLRWRTVSNSREYTLAWSPVRTFWPVNRHALIFGIRDSVKTDYLIYDFSLMKAQVYATHLPGSEDLYWHPQLGLLIALGKEIHRYDPASKNWSLLFDLGTSGITKITRFVFDPEGKKLAVVDNPASN